jgi:hypothetical protein
VDRRQYRGNRGISPTTDEIFAAHPERRTADARSGRRARRFSGGTAIAFRKVEACGRIARHRRYAMFDRTSSATLESIYARHHPALCIAAA